MTVKHFISTKNFQCVQKVTFGVLLTLNDDLNIYLKVNKNSSLSYYWLLKLGSCSDLNLYILTNI